MVTKELVAKALARHAQGQLAEAETIYQQVLAQHPNAFRAIEGLGILVFQQGRFSEAAALFARGLAVRPGSARTHANLGEALRLLGHTDRAIDHLRQAAAIDSTLAQVPNSMGLIAFEQGRRDEAEAAYREAVRLDPQLAAPRINLANVHHARHCETKAAGELRLALKLEPDNLIAIVTLAQVLCDTGDLDLLDEAEALGRRATAIAPHFPPAFESLGNVLRAQKRYPEALASFEQAAKLDPGRGLPFHYMGEHFQKLGNLDEAARCYSRARALEPNEARFHADCGSLELARGHHELAAQHYQRAVECNPHMAESYHGLGLARLEQSRLEEAEGLFRQALRIEPFHVSSWCALARLEAEIGDFDSSCRSARAALEISPGLPDAFWRLASILKGNLPDDEARTMEALLTTRSLTENDRALLHFGLALVCDGRGQYAQAASHTAAANELQRSAKAARGESYDADRHSQFVDRTIATFTPEFVERARGWGDPDPRPVFVVGLPRTGTTLVEQILASHPLVFGAGERQELQQLFLTLPELLGQPSADPFEVLPSLDAASANTAAKVYLDKLNSLAPSTAARIVDKMPDNVRFLGVIAMLFPRARVIICTRDLRDVALSCWRTGFENIPWANDWNHIARRFADHQRIVNHWRHVLPAGACFVRYEDLVQNLEQSARDLIDFLGLEWDPACLQFHETKRVVRTASLSQVRKPLYNDSIERWRHYEPQLHPMFDAFMRHGVRWE